MKKVLLPQFWKNSEIELLKVTCFTKEIFADVTASSLLCGNSLHESFKDSDFTPSKEKMKFLNKGSFKDRMAIIFKPIRCKPHNVTIRINSFSFVNEILQIY